MIDHTLDIISKDQYLTSNPGDDHPWVQRIAQEHWGPNFLIERNFINRAFIAFVQQGRGYVESSNTGLAQIDAGCALYFSDDGTTHKLWVEPEGELRLLLFTLGNRCGAEMATHYSPGSNVVLPLADPGPVESLFYRLLDVGKKGGFLANRIAGTLVEPILLTVIQEYRSHATADDRVFALFSRCRVYIENNWQEISSINDVPGVFGISQPYMGKLFRRFEGCTPHQFLLKQKMNYAIYELQAGGSSIGSIASKLGFADGYSFSKTFKRVIGKPPSAFR